MTLREKILKTFVVTIREINTHGGPQSFFARYPVGSMYFGECEPLLDENGLEVGTQTTFEKLNECKKYAPHKLLVCADGASIRGQTFVTGCQRSLGATPDRLQDAYLYGRMIGMQMNDKGIDWVLGPSMDLCLDHAQSLTAVSDDAAVTAEIYREVIRGIHSQGICTTAKHFPGLGTHPVNMHMAPGQNTLPFDQWMDTYGHTYRSAIDTGTDCIMTTHITLRSYDNTLHNGFYPIATFSPKLTTELLKEKLGFSGAVVTDALIMGGMATGDLIAETVQAFRAGADLLLWPPVEAADKIEELILSGDIPMSRLDDALARIARMESFRDHALHSGTAETPDPVFADTFARQLTAKGICLLRNDLHLLPMHPTAISSVLIVDGTDDDDPGSAAFLRDALTARGITADIRRDIYDVPSRVCWQNDIDALQAPYDLVLFNMNTTYGTWSVPLMLIWASHLFRKEKKIIVNYGSPYFAYDYFPEDPTYIEMNCRPSRAAAEALADRLLGVLPFTGCCTLTHPPVLPK